MPPAQTRACRTLTSQRRSSYIGTAVPVLCLFVLATLHAPVAAVASTSALYDSMALPGPLAEALVRAYAVFASTHYPEQAPYALRDYSVQLLSRPSETLVSFFPNEQGKLVNVTLKPGQAVGQDDFQPTLDAEPILLPGVTAGEVIAAFSEAKRRGDVVVANPSPAFRVSIEVWAGGSNIAFVPLHAPASLPKGKCLSGNCNGRTLYSVRISGGKVIVSQRSVL